MNKNLLPLSIMFLGVCLVISSFFISQSLKFNGDKEKIQIKQSEKLKLQNRYEFIKITDNHYIIFDRHSGDYWSQDNGLDNWIKQKPNPTSSK
ncbi:hypothetical protein ACFVR2_20310 [Gottfriedia sp. NPDC057991]|uniref:hypothetical protein n=1 Tax=Gottfriedia sp. NPDC057991 TaxID=3346298 RepID=UPI0036DF6894